MADSPELHVHPEDGTFNLTDTEDAALVAMVNAVGAGDADGSFQADFPNLTLSAYTKLQKLILYGATYKP